MNNELKNLNGGEMLMMILPAIQKLNAEHCRLMQLIEKLINKEIPKSNETDKMSATLEELEDGGLVMNLNYKKGSGMPAGHAGHFYLDSIEELSVVAETAQEYIRKKT